MFVSKKRNCAIQYQNFSELEYTYTRAILNMLLSATDDEIYSEKKLLLSATLQTKLRLQSKLSPLLHSCTAKFDDLLKRIDPECFASIIESFMTIRVQQFEYLTTLVRIR